MEDEKRKKLMRVLESIDEFLKEEKSRHEKGENNVDEVKKKLLKAQKELKELLEELYSE